MAPSHVRLAEGAPPEVLEGAFTSAPDLAPANVQARHNMEVIADPARLIEGVIRPFSPGNRHRSRYGHHSPVSRVQAAFQKESPE